MCPHTIWVHHHFYLHSILFKYDVMITPDLVEELLTWKNDPFFIDNVRAFSRIHEQDIRLEYDPFLHENRLEFHTGNTKCH